MAVIWCGQDYVSATIRDKVWVDFVESVLYVEWPDGVFGLKNNSEMEFEHFLNEN